jgi:hypothetical protein
MTSVPPVLAKIIIFMIKIMPDWPHIVRSEEAQGPDNGTSPAIRAARVEKMGESLEYDILCSHDPATENQPRNKREKSAKNTGCQTIE